MAVVHHPCERGNATICEVPYRCQNLEQLKCQFTGGQEVLAGIDGKQIMPDMWARTRVAPGSKVVFLPAVAGPLLSAAAAWVWASLPTILLTVGLSYLGGMLFGPSMNQPAPKSRGETGQSFAWNPITTQQEGIPHPVCYGTNMHYGNVVARWTDVDENGSEILYMIIDYGRGPVQGKGSNIVYINDQPAGNFPGVSIQERLGTLNQTCMTGFEQNKLEYRPGLEITNSGGPVTWTTPNNFFDDIEYTLENPRGLWHYQEDGSQVSHGVGVKVEISERGLSSWTTLMDTTISGNQLAPVYKAYKVSEQGFNCVHGKQYDLKHSKTTTDKGVDRWGDELVLRSVREVVDVAFTRPGKALLGITALATERLSGHINVKWVADDKLVRVYNGTSWGVAFSRNRAWVVLDELTQPVISGDGGANPWVIERYEGLDPNRIDLAFFYEWAEWCDQQVTDGDGGTEDRMPCDIIVDYETDVWSCAYELSQIGRMYPYWQGNVLTGWVDKAVDETIDLISFDNVMVRSWRNLWAGGERAGSVEIFYKDALQGYERKTLPRHNEDAGLYTRIVKIEGAGVTGHALAARTANHAVQRNKLIKNFNSVRMYKDALRYRLGRVVRLQSNVPNWGASYRVIKSEANNTVELDRVCTASPGDIIYLRTYDETNEKVSIDSYTVSQVAGKVVTIAETWSVTPIKGNIFAVGQAGAIKLRRIVKMRHAVENYFDVELETYDTALFASDNINPNIPNPDYKWPQPAAELARPVSKWEVVDLINQMLPPRPDIDIPWTSNLEWTGDEVDTVSWSKRNADEPILFRYRGVSYEITPDDTADEFIYWDPNYTTQFRTTNVASVALAAGNWLMCTNEDGVAHPANAMQLLHAAIILAGTIRAEQYAELRNTYVYNGDDSLDASHPLEIPFKIVSEMTAIVSVKLSFKIMSYRAYSTAAASGGGQGITSGSGGGQTSSSGGGQTSSGAAGYPYTNNTSYASAGNTAAENLGSHYHEIGDTDSADCGGGVHSHGNPNSYSANLGSHSHSITATHRHEYGVANHTHTVNDHTHTVSDHTHSVSLPNHTHGITYGLHEESNSPTVHFHVNNGSGYGDPSANYTADQLDIDITSLLSETGWKSIRFDTTLRCRIAAIIECKLDITA